MTTPTTGRYSKEHEWLKIDGGEATIGITDYAQEQLGDIVYVDLPEVGRALTKFEKMGEIESVKAVSELFSPATGEVIAANEAWYRSRRLVKTTRMERVAHQGNGRSRRGGRPDVGRRVRGLLHGTGLHGCWQPRLRTDSE